jgi:hypothetical protein
MSTAGFTIQIIAIIIGLMAVGLFAKSNITIMHYRKLTQWGLLELWTGSINTGKLVIVDGKNNKVVEKELIKAIVLHKRARVIGYVCLLVNLAALLFHQ